MGTRGLVQ